MLFFGGKNATFCDNTRVVAQHTRFADKHKHARACERERERDDVEGKKSAVDVAVVTFFAFSRFSLLSFFLSKMSFIGEKRKKKRINDDEFVTGRRRRRSAIRDGDDDDTER